MVPLEPDGFGNSALTVSSTSMQTNTGKKTELTEHVWMSSQISVDSGLIFKSEQTVETSHSSVVQLSVASPSFWGAVCFFVLQFLQSFCLLIKVKMQRKKLSQPYLFTLSSFYCACSTKTFFS